MHGMRFSPTKCVVNRRERANLKKVILRDTCAHILLIPFISTAGQMLTPLVVLRGVAVQYQTRRNGKFESRFDFFSRPHNLFMRPVEAINTNKFFNWVWSCSWLWRDTQTIFSCTHFSYLTITVLSWWRTHFSCDPTTGCVGFRTIKRRFSRFMDVRRWEE